ncbi:MAG: LytTR family DNA-binding domain-containing protein [Bacteroidales bacterium]|jgi:two-component system LytT family response regulator
MINCIAIDKDGEALAELSSHIEKIPFLSLVGTYSNPLEANGILARRGVDLVFADPDMNPINGIDFIRSLVHNPMVVFITNNPGYAVEAYSSGVLDYIVKPLTLERLIRVANKAYELALPYKEAATIRNQAGISTPFVFMKVDNRMQRFRTDDILFIEGCNDYIRVYTSGSKPALASMNMKNIERKLPQGHFCRVHRSYIVSLSRIDSIEHKRIRIGERVIPVSNSYYAVLLQAIDLAVPA